MIWVSLLCLTGCVAIAAIQTPYDPFVVRRAALDPGSCPMPCFTGIRPGVTSMEQAVQLLRHNPYVDPSSIHPLAPGESAGTVIASWRTPLAMLSGTSADISGQDIQIRNTPGQDVVNMVIVPINVPLGDFLPLFGPPSRSSLTRGPGLNGDLFYVLEYPDLGMQYDSWVACKPGQVIASLIGTTYMLQTPSNFISLVATADNLGWHGFTSRPFDQMAKENQCPTGESPLNRWFAQLVGS